MDIGPQLKIIFCKNVSSGIRRRAVWAGESLSWTKKRGRTRQSVPYHKLLYSDCMDNLVTLNINWCKMTNKSIYPTVSNDLNGGIFPYKIFKCIRILNVYQKHFCQKLVKK